MRGRRAGRRWGRSRRASTAAGPGSHFHRMSRQARDRRAFPFLATFLCSAGIIRAEFMGSWTMGAPLSAETVYGCTAEDAEDAEDAEGREKRDERSWDRAPAQTCRFPSFAAFACASVNICLPVCAREQREPTGRRQAVASNVAVLAGIAMCMRRSFACVHGGEHKAGAALGHPAARQGVGTGDIGCREGSAGSTADQIAAELNIELVF
jgi:hypothetical protein